MEKKKVVIIGSGNVATHLALGLASQCELVQVYSRNVEHAQELARRAGIPHFTSNLETLMPDADVYIVAVSDDAIASVVAIVPDTGALWLHTSGTTGLDVLQAHRVHCGVLYPMQSFSRELPVDWKQVHIFVEASDKQSLRVTEQLAHLLTDEVVPCNSEQRRVLHVAAVFSCNFVNHLWVQAAALLERHGLPFESMMPLITNTVEKLRHLTPLQSQTGPAVRGDQAVMDRHRAMLEGRQREIYDLMSESIMATRQSPQ